MVSITPQLREVGQAPNGEICFIREGYHCVHEGDLANIKYKEFFGRQKPTS